MPDHQAHLATILTPARLRDVFEGYIPWPREQELDFSAVVGRYLHGQLDLVAFRKICYPTLQALSAIPLEEMPDLLRILPPPEDPGFPVQAVGLIVLLDQAPRFLLEGMDERWILGFFDALALKTLRAVVELPDDLRPNTLHRWTQAGYTFGHWLVANVWFLSPFVHSEDLADHATLHRFVASTRDAVQKRTNHTDPRILSPITVTSELFQHLRAGPRKDEAGNVVMHEWVYWVLAVYEGQSYLLRTFDGRCPFYNGALGRKDTPQEAEFLEAFNCMGCVTPEVESRIAADIQAGKWTPLGG